MDDCTIKQEPTAENDSKQNEAGNPEPADIQENIDLNVKEENSMGRVDILPEHDRSRIIEKYVSVPEKDSVNRRIEVERSTPNNNEDDEFDAFGDECAVLKKYRLRPQKSEDQLKKEKAENKLVQKPIKHRSRYDSEEETNLQCPQCKFLCQSRTGLLNHLRTHQTVTVFTCSLCSESFDTNNELMVHKKRPDHEQQMFLCKPCQLAFSNHMDYLLHMVQHTKRPPYRCKECPKVLNTKEGFKIHIRTHFDQQIECSTCGKCFKSEIRYNVHFNTHSKVLKCGECEKECKSAESLKYHMVSHTGVKLYQCIYCGKGFANNSGRKIHTRIHTDERPYECKVCLRRFHQSTDLNCHKGVHDTERDAFECQFCNKKYLQKSSLKWHLRSHTKTDLFPCSECGKEFTLFSNLRSHMIHMHTDVRVYGCDVCQLKFKMKKGLLRHNKSLRHKNNVYGAISKQKQVS